MQSQNTVVYAGVDVAKATLQLHLQGQQSEFRNTPKGLLQLVAQLQTVPSVQVVCEATGGYERALVKALHQGQIPVSVTNPARVRAAAQAQGQRAKTDQIDARGLTDYGQRYQPEPTPPTSATQDQLVALTQWLKQLIHGRALAKTQAEHHQDPFVRRQHAKLMTHLQSQVEAVEKQIEALLQQDAALQQRGILLEQGFNLFFHRLDLGLEMGHELGMLPADKRILMMLGLGFGQGPPMDQLLEPLGQGHQLVLGGRSGWRRFWLIALAIIGQAPRVDPIGFGPLALGLGGGAHPGRIGHRERDEPLMQALDQGAFIATGGFANHVNAGNLFELRAQLVPALRGIGELTLLALQMKLQGGFGDIHAGVDDWGFGFHSCDRVLTHPYLYELTGLAAALATVRVWSTGRARLWLGYGLAQGRPRVARARARRRSPFAQGRRPHVLACARKARDRKERSNQMTASPQRAPRSPGRRFAGSFSLRGSTPRRAARPCGTEGARTSAR